MQYILPHYKWIVLRHVVPLDILCVCCRMIKILVNFFRAALWKTIRYEMSNQGHVTMMVSHSACPGVDRLLEIMNTILCTLHKSVDHLGARSVMIMHVCPLSEATVFRVCIFTRFV